MSNASRCAVAQSFPQPPLATGTCVSHCAARSQASAVTLPPTKAAWADLEDSTTEEKEQVQSGTEAVKLKWATNTSTAHTELSATAPPSTATGVTMRHEPRSAANNSAVHHAVKEKAEKDVDILELSGYVFASSTSGASNIELVKDCQDNEEQNQHCNQDDVLPSKGSVHHERGGCVPCLFVNRTPSSCHNGAACAFCHLPHQKNRKPRLSKDRRDRFQRRVEDIERKLDTERHLLIEDPDWIEKMVHELPPSFEGNPALKSKLVAKLNQCAEQILAAQSTVKGADAMCTLEVKTGHFSGLSTAESTAESSREQPAFIGCRTDEAHVQDSRSVVLQPSLTGSKAGISTKTSL